ncbi:MAG: PAS domain S-box protein [Chloroflexota bacterium]
MRQPDQGCLSHGGEAGAILRAIDWSVHPLGLPSTWPLSLQSTVRTILASRFPMMLHWGPDYITFYNDAYIPSLGEEHPRGLGRSVHEHWPAVAQRLQPVWNRVLAGESVQLEDAEYTVQRGSKLVHGYFTHGHSPVWNDAGEIEGILLIVTETTSRVMAERDLTLTNARLSDQVDALRTSEAQFRTFAQAVPNHVWTAPPDGALDWFNDRVYDYAGVAAGQLDGDGWTTLVHPDDLEAAAARWSAALASGAPYEAEFRLRRADGVFRWHIARAVPIRGADGEITRWIGTNTDIEDQKTATETLTHLNATLEQQVAERTADRNRLWQLSTDIMLVARFDGVILAVNPASSAVLGWDEGELVGTNLLDLAHPDDLDRIAEAAASLLNGMALSRFDNRYRHKDGSYRWIAWSAVPGGGVISAVGRDFTAEKAQAEALERSEARIRSIFDTSYQYQGLMTPEGILLDANPASLTGIEARLEDVVGRPFWDTPWFTGTSGLPEQIKAAVPLVASGQRFRREFAIDLPTGRRIFDYSMRPVFNSAGEVIAIVPEAMELTERRSAEEQLRQSQKMEAIGQLTGGIAHDFNNLLTGITGSLEMIRRRLDGTDQDGIGRYMDAASAAAQRAAALTHRLLAFARRQSLDTRPSDVNALVADLEDMLHRTLGQSVRLQTELATDLWPALTDANQFENALLNLAINARDAMPDGGQLTIRTANTSLDEAYAREHNDAVAGEYVEVSVSDTGAGMSAEVMAKAFDPFFTTRPIGQGTGLGLSMIYGFVKQSGGFVCLESAPGQGTTARMFLRRALEEEEVVEPAPAVETPRGRGETVLVVEDDETIRLLITEVLEDLGYRYVEAPDAQTAIPVLESVQSLDLLVTDVGLPIMNGRQLAEIARQHRPDLKVLFITGYAPSAASRRGFLEPGMEMMAKPFDLDALGVKIRELLEA